MNAIIKAAALLAIVILIGTAIGVVIWQPGTLIGWTP